MKYAELRKCLASAERHAAEMKRQADVANGVLLGLAREEDGCGHRTIRRDGLPCPHSACSGGRSDVLRVFLSPPLSSFAEGFLSPSSPIPPRDVTTLRRERYVSRAGDIWAWKVEP